MKKNFTKSLLIFVLFLFLGASPISTQEENQVNIYFFWGKGCPHCAKEKVFLENLVQKYPNIELKSFELNKSESIKLLQKASELLNTDTRSIPFTVIGNQYFVGYLDDETSGRPLKKAVEQALQRGCPDILGNAAKTILPSPSPCPPESPKEEVVPETINLPILGKVKTKNISLPFLTIVMGILDGFNPCAMWTLLFLISLLLGMNDRKRMWILGTAFVFTSAFVYFLFMSAWLNLFLFLGLIVWVRILIGFTALGAGFYNLRDYLVNKEGGCKVTGGEKRQKTFSQIRKVTQKRKFILALAGIILLAFAVNLVELICSASLPAVYTQILSFNQLPTWQYYLYLLLYIFFFMIDDLLVFFIAMFTFQAVGVGGKYARFSRLIGGILMVLIGVLMLLKPELLMFG